MSFVDSGDAPAIILCVVRSPPGYFDADRGDKGGGGDQRTGLCLVPPHLRALENNLNKPRGGKHVRCLAPAPPRIKPTQHWGFLCESGITRAKGAAAGFAFQPLLKG